MSPREQSDHPLREPATLTGEHLARFVTTTGWGDLDHRLRHEACRSLVNVFACAIGSSRDPAVDAAMDVLAPFCGSASASIIGRGERMDAMCASFVNAIATNVLDYDDTHLDTVIHPSAPVAPPVLALAETDRRSGADALLAFVLGAEVACRLGAAVSPDHYARGWHITATCGVFGAAAAASKLLGLDLARTWHALGIAASQSAGVVENLPSGAKNVGVGNAARNGLFAALLARRGYAAAPAAIDGRLGWARAAGTAVNARAVTEGLGERWEFARNTYKPYPCGIVMHAVIDACLALRDHPALDGDAIESVTVQGNALLLARGDRPVADARDARVSIHHAAAVALLFGRAGPDEFSERCVSDPQVTAMRQRVQARELASLPTGAARVSIRGRAGSRIDTTVTHARGSEHSPLADDALDEKLAAMCERAGARIAPAPLGDALWSLADCGNVAQVMALARGG